jgi:hypothetical protein
MKTLKVFRQADQEWARVDVGESDEDMAAVGCLVSSLAMASNWLLDTDITPADVNQWLLEDPACFIGANMVIHKAAEQVGLKAPAEDRVRGSPTDLKVCLNKVFSKKGHAAILHVATDGGFKGRHFIFCNGLDENGDIQVADPAPGEKYTIPFATLTRDVKWRSKTKKYRIVSVIPISKP